MVWGEGGLCLGPGHHPGTRSWATSDMVGGLGVFLQDDVGHPPGSLFPFCIAGGLLFGMTPSYPIINASLSSSAAVRRCVAKFPQGKSDQLSHISQALPLKRHTVPYALSRPGLCGVEVRDAKMVLPGRSHLRVQFSGQHGEMQ